jgi:hypothetical protein
MRWYQLDSTRLSFREYWRWKPGIPFCFCAMKKLFGIRITSGQCYARPDVLQPIDPDDLPDKHRSVLGPLVAQSGTLGFELGFFYSVPTKGPVSGSAAALTSTDRWTLLLLVHSAPRNSQQPFQPAYGFYSCAADGRILATAGGLPGLIGVAPEIQVIRLRHRPLDQTCERHSERLRAEGGGLVAFRTQEVADSVLRILQRNFDYNVNRGVFVPLPESELDEANSIRS